MFSAINRYVASCREFERSASDFMAAVDDDPIEPGLDGTSTRERRRVAENANPGFLNGVTREVATTIKQSAGKPEQRPFMARSEETEGIAVALDERSQERFV